MTFFLSLIVISPLLITLLEGCAAGQSAYKTHHPYFDVRTDIEVSFCLAMDPVRFEEI